MTSQSRNIQEAVTPLLDVAARQRYAPPFLGISEEEADFERAKIAVLPIPYDGTSTYHKGADRGPKALLEASAQVELYDIETASEVHHHGIATLAPLIAHSTVEELTEQIKLAVSFLVSEQKFPVVLGGEHSISPGVVSALTEFFNDISVLQLDAHGDTRESYLGSRFNHACAMARIREHVPIVQVGIRAIDASEAPRMDPSRVFWAHDILRAGDNLAWQTQVSKRLTSKVYVTIDLDCFDSSIMPSTGTPEPGGLDWYRVTSLLKRVALEHDVVGFDVVELLPRESNPAPDFLAAKLVHQFLSYCFSKPERR